MKKIILIVMFMSIIKHSIFASKTMDYKYNLKELTKTADDSKYLLKTKAVMLGMSTNVVVPLEIISDIEIQAFILDDEQISIPFEIEFNKKPSKRDFYKIKYSENKIDIDNDGKFDTYIYSNKNIDSNILKDNYVIIHGKNITKTGYHEKIIYLTVETHD